MTEAEAQAAILLLGRGDTRLFRNHVGAGFTGRVVRTSPGQAVRIEPGMVLLEDARHATFGLCPGSSDVIGWRSVEITPDMVGRKVAVFAAIEVKSATGRAERHQANFCDIVRKAGGMAGIARSPDQARAVLGKTE